MMITVDIVGTKDLAFFVNSIPFIPEQALARTPPPANRRKPD